MGFTDADSLLRTLLKDLLVLMGALRKQESHSKDEKAESNKIEGKVLDAIDQSKLNFSNVFPEKEEDLYSFRGTFSYKLLYILLLFAEISASR